MYLPRFPRRRGSCHPGRLAFTNRDGNPFAEPGRILQVDQMTMRYAHLAPKAFAADFDRFGTEAPVAPPAQVIELPQAAP